jgi:hypothetical protein
MYKPVRRTGLGDRDGNHATESNYYPNLHPDDVRESFI